MNEYDRHLEHLKHMNILCIKKERFKGMVVRRILLKNVQITENLHMAISKLPEVQKRRLNKYYFEEKTFDKIALEEGCTFINVCKDRCIVQ